MAAPSVKLSATVAGKTKLVYNQSHLLSATVDVLCLPADSTQQEKKRPPCTLVTVIDVSGSMGSSLNLVKDTTKFLISQLFQTRNPKQLDFFGIVAFGSTSKVVLQLTPLDVSGKTIADTAVDSLKIEGCTNLAAGFVDGLKQLASRSRDSSNNCTLLLMTDGHANIGSTTTDAILAEASPHLTKVKERSNLTIHTFGYDLNHSPTLMRGIAEKHKGMYYFIRDRNSFSSTFAECLGGLVSAGARNLKLVITAQNGCKIEDIKTNFLKKRKSDFATDIDLEDIDLEENRNVPVTFTVPRNANPGTNILVAKVSLEYTLAASASQSTSEVSIHVDRVLPENEGGKKVEITKEEKEKEIQVDQHTNRLMVADALEKATHLGTGNRLAEAKKVLQEAQQQLRGSISYETPFIRQLEKDLETAINSLSSTSEFQGVGAKFMYSLARSHYTQRSSGISTSSAAAYLTQTKKRMIRAAAGQEPEPLPLVSSSSSSSSSTSSNNIVKTAPSNNSKKAAVSVSSSSSSQNTSAAASSSSSVQPPFVNLSQKKVSQELLAKAVRRLMLDLKEVQKNPLPSVAALPLDSDLFEWHCCLKGPEGTAYSGVVFHLVLQFPQTYPAEPPTLYICSFISHQHVFNSWVCLDLLQEESWNHTLEKNKPYTGWSSAYSVQTILLQLQSFLFDEASTLPTDVSKAAKSSSEFSCTVCGHCNKNPWPVVSSSPVEKKSRKGKEPASTETSILSVTAIAPAEKAIIAPRALKAQQDKVLKKVQPQNPIAQVIKKLTPPPAPVPSQWATPLIAPAPAPVPAPAVPLPTPVAKPTTAAPKPALVATPPVSIVTPIPAAIATRTPAPKVQAKASSSTSTAKAPIQSPISKETKVETKKTSVSTPAKTQKKQKVDNCGWVTVEVKKKKKEVVISEKQQPEREQRRTRDRRRKEKVEPVVEEIVEEETVEEEEEIVEEEEPKVIDPLKKAKNVKRTQLKNLKRGEKRRQKRVAEAALALSKAKPAPAPKKETKPTSPPSVASPSPAPIIPVPVARKPEEKKVLRSVVAVPSPTAQVTSRTAPATVQPTVTAAPVVPAQPATPSLAQMLSSKATLAPKVNVTVPPRQQATTPRVWKTWDFVGLVNGKTNLLSLGDDLISNVLGYLRMRDLKNVNLVCKDLYHLSNKVWKQILSSYFRDNQLFSPVNSSGSLEAECSSSWKKAAAAQKQRNSDGLVCFHSKLTINEDILGIPISFTRHPSGELKEISSTMDLVSYEAFYEDGVRKTVWKETFTHWLPLYITKDHYNRASPYIREAIRDIASGGKRPFQPEMVFEVLPPLMCTMVVKMMSGNVHASIVALEGYCAFHRLLLQFAEEFPELRRKVNQMAVNFCRSDSFRIKDVVPSLGHLLSMLSVSDQVTWEQLCLPYLQESFDRHVLWAVRDHPWLAKLPSSTVNGDVDHRRIETSFKSSIVSHRLLMFHVYFFKNVARPEGLSMIQVADMYDNFFGRPSDSLKEALQLKCKEILNKTDKFDDFFRGVGMRTPSPSYLTAWLRQAVRNSERKGYHGGRRNTNGRPTNNGERNGERSYFSSSSSSSGYRR